MSASAAHPCVCSFCGAPVPDGDGGDCLAYSETLAWLQCDGGSGDWQGECADLAYEEAEQTAEPSEVEGEVTP